MRTFIYLCCVLNNHKEFFCYGNKRDKTTANDGSGTGKIWVKAR